MELNFATAWEAISDEIPDSDALLCGESHRSWRDYEERAARVANALAAAELPVGANVGLGLYNGTAYGEVQSRHPNTSFALIPLSDTRTGNPTTDGPRVRRSRRSGSNAAPRLASPKVA